MLVVLLVWAGFAWRSGQRSARFYFVAFAGVFLGVLVNRFALDQVLPHTGFTEWILEIGVAWEVVWLAVAVADHINDTVRENAMLHASEMQLQHLATIDGLTSIPNRRAFDMRLDSEWNRAKRTSRSIALLLVDIDHFKQYNDTYGHLAGDDCLRRVARSIAAAATRSSDFVARYGGEEFAVFLPEADVEEAWSIAERTRMAVLELAIPHERSAERCVTISVGLAAWTPTPAQAPSALVAAADGALYDSKRSGRNAVTRATGALATP
jgi:diguanylate cyclase (GGDEF)-like protein